MRNRFLAGIRFPILFLVAMAILRQGIGIASFPTCSRIPQSKSSPKSCCCSAQVSSTADCCCCQSSSDENQALSLAPAWQPCGCKNHQFEGVAPGVYWSSLDHASLLGSTEPSSSWLDTDHETGWRIYRCPLAPPPRPIELDAWCPTSQEGLPASSLLARFRRSNGESIS